MNAWFESAEAQRILRKLNRINTISATKRQIYGDPYEQWFSPEAAERALIKLHNAEVDRLAGFTWNSVFHAAYDGDKARQWMAIADSIPSVSDAIDATFARRDADATTRAAA